MLVLHLTRYRQKFREDNIFKIRWKNFRQQNHTKSPKQEKTFSYFPWHPTKKKTCHPSQSVHPSGRSTSADKCSLLVLPPDVVWHNPTCKPCVRYSDPCMYCLIPLDLSGKSNQKVSSRNFYFLEILKKTVSVSLRGDKYELSGGIQKKNKQLSEEWLETSTMRTERKHRSRHRMVLIALLYYQF